MHWWRDWWVLWTSRADTVKDRHNYVHAHCSRREKLSYYWNRQQRMRENTGKLDIKLMSECEGTLLEMLECDMLLLLLLLRPGWGSEYCDQFVYLSPCVCLSVCSLDRSSRNSVCTSRVTVARSCSGGVAICYVLPVLWMTLRLGVVGRIWRCVEGSTFNLLPSSGVAIPGWGQMSMNWKAQPLTYYHLVALRYRGGVRCLWMPCYSSCSCCWTSVVKIPGLKAMLKPISGEWLHFRVVDDSQKALAKNCVKSPYNHAQPLKKELGLVINPRPLGNSVTQFLCRGYIWNKIISAFVDVRLK